MTYREIGNFQTLPVDNGLSEVFQGPNLELGRVCGSELCVIFHVGHFWLFFLLSLIFFEPMAKTGPTRTQGGNRRRPVDWSFI